MIAASKKLHKHYLMPSTLYVDKRPTQIQTVLGSCIAVCIYDVQLKYGGMNHYMLPVWKNEGLATPKYGNIAIPKLIEKMLRNNSRKKDLVAKIFGGSNHFLEKNFYEIGKRNVEIAHELLSNEGIQIAAQDVGGQISRTVYMDTESNVIHLKRF